MNRLPLVVLALGILALLAMTLGQYFLASDLSASFVLLVVSSGCIVLVLVSVVSALWSPRQLGSWVCPDCGRKNPVENRYCGSCGRPLKHETRAED